MPLITEWRLQFWEWFTSNEVVGQRAPRNPQTTWDIAKAIGRSPQTDSKALMLKATATQLIEYEKIPLVPT